MPSGREHPKRESTWRRPKVGSVATYGSAGSATVQLEPYTHPLPATAAELDAERENGE